MATMRNLKLCLTNLTYLGSVIVEVMHGMDHQLVIYNCYFVFFASVAK